MAITSNIAELNSSQGIAVSNASAFKWEGPFESLDELKAAMGARSSTWVPGRVGKVLADSSIGVSGGYLEYIVTSSKTLVRKTPVSVSASTTATITDTVFKSKMPDSSAINGDTLVALWNIAGALG